MKLKNYNVFSAIIEYRVIITLIFITNILVFFLTKNSNYSLLFSIVAQIIFFIILTVNNMSSFLNVRNYIMNNESKINDKYQIRTSFGYNFYFKDFTSKDIEKLIDSIVRDDFVRCYIFPIKMGMLIIVTFTIFILISLLDRVFAM
ncbi:hypothetical protein AD998_06875 [bacterium 336/3]|nr:hypothetical protein AD998_06875 [bacterium 336/3]